MKATPYLYFKGDCEAALHFYAACGLGEIRELRRYDGTPMVGRHGEVWRDKVLHSLFAGPGVRFYAGDGPDSGRPLWQLHGPVRRAVGGRLREAADVSGARCSADLPSRSSLQLKVQGARRTRDAPSE
jgi:hypothetical protein